MKFTKCKRKRKKIALKNAASFKVADLDGFHYTEQIC